MKKLLIGTLVVVVVVLVAMIGKSSLKADELEAADIDIEEMTDTDMSDERDPALMLAAQEEMPLQEDDQDVEEDEYTPEQEEFMAEADESDTDNELFEETIGMDIKPQVISADDLGMMDMDQEEDVLVEEAKPCGGTCRVMDIDEE